MNGVATSVFMFFAAMGGDDRLQLTLEQYLELPEAQRTASYPLTRCSGLFLALVQSGTDILSSDNFMAMTDWARGLMEDSAAHIILEDNVSVATATDQAIERTDNFKISYLSQISTSSTPKNLFSNRSLIAQDMKICLEIVIERK